MPLRVAHLTPETRSRLLEPALACSPARPVEHLLQALHYAPPALREELDAAFAGAFPGLHVRLDDTEQVNLCLRLASAFPDAGEDAILAVRQYAALERADQQGAGVQGFLAVVLTMLLCQGRVILLDQPAAGLHPETARRLGLWIGQNAARLNCQVILNTHSASLLDGLLDSATDVTILRLTRSDDTTSVQAVPSDVCGLLSRHPLLAAQRALDCLFCEGVVLVPLADDRVVYETVAQRFVGQAAGIQFLQTYGGRHLGALAKVLRSAGIPACVVADLEVMHSDASFADLVTAVSGSPPPDAWQATRERLAKHVGGLLDERELSASTNEVESFLEQMKKGDAATDSAAVARGRTSPREKWARLQRGQLSGVPPELRVWVEELLDDLKHKGVFISPKGGFPGWLPTEAADRETAFAKAVQTLHRGECPADLRAFVAELLAHLRAVAAPRRAARTRPPGA
jgi:hypothetical protein